MEKQLVISARLGVCLWFSFPWEQQVQFSTDFEVWVCGVFKPSICPEPVRPKSWSKVFLTVWSSSWCFEGKSTEMSFFSPDEHKMQIEISDTVFPLFFWFLSPGNYSNYLGRNLSEAESSLSFRSALKLVGFYPFALSSCSHRGRSHKFCPIVMGKASHAESLVLCSAFLLASHFEANLLLQCHGRITFSCLVVFSR